MPKDSGIIDQLFDTAFALREEKADFQARQEANRNALRTMRDAGVMTDDQAAQVEELYPTRQRRTGDDIEPGE